MPVKVKCSDFSPNSLLVYGGVFQKVENYAGVCLYSEMSNRYFSVVKTDEFCAAEGPCTF